MRTSCAVASAKAVLSELRRPQELGVAVVDVDPATGPVVVGVLLSGLGQHAGGPRDLAEPDEVVAGLHEEQCAFG